MSVKIFEHVISYEGRRDLMFTSSNPIIKLMPCALRVIRNSASRVNKMFCSKLWWFFLFEVSVH